MNRNDHEEVRALVGRINDAWLKNPSDKIPELLNEAFDDEIVVYGPDWKEIGRGKQACVNSYAEFARHAMIHECQLSEPSIHVRGDTAVAIYGWDMRYGLNGQDYRERGHDVFVFTRTQGGWRTVWRLLLVSPPAEPPPDRNS